MSSQSHYTSAGNFLSGANGGVDPRTGLFNIHLPLASVHANALMGPALSLNLLYSPLSAANCGFGKGFRLSLSRYDTNTGALHLSTGDEYRVDSSGKVKQQKQKNFIFNKIGGDFQVVHKKGLTEQLVLQKGIYVPKRIVGPDGRGINLEWSTLYATPRLTRITDDDKTVLCEVTYPNSETSSTKFTSLPNEPSLCQRSIFSFYDDFLTKITSDVVNPSLVWTFNYENVGAAEMYRVITSYISPTGLTEKVVYINDGMAFPDIAGLPPLPCVSMHELTPGASQPKRKTKWEFTQKNYLGKNAPVNLWQPDEDHMLNTFLTDYKYGSTEHKLDDEEKLVTKIIRHYNSYHLLETESTVRGGKTNVKETNYYAKPGKAFIDQPPHYSLPNTKTEHWFDVADETSKRSVQTHMEFDEYGNPTRHEAPDGTITEFTYYEANGEDGGCPADPNGFVRFMKQKKTIPARIAGNELNSSTLFTYVKLGDSQSIVKESESNYSADKLVVKRNWKYNHDREHKEFGRVSAITNVLYDRDDNSKSYTSTQNFTTDVSNGILTKTTTLIGHDEVQASIKRKHCIYSGRVHSEISAEGVETRYEYDALGRIIRQTLCPDSPYEHNTSYEYHIDEMGPCTTKVDVAGNKSVTHFDGTGEAIRQRKFDGKTSQWYETFSQQRNSLAEVISGTVKDWVPGTDRSFPLTSNTIHDDWGQKHIVTFSNSTKEFHENDPVNLTQSFYKQGFTGDNKSVRTGSAISALDKKTQLVISREMKHATGEQYNICHYAWNGHRQLIEETDESGNITKRTYDEYGRVLTQTLPDGTIVSQTYAPHQLEKLVTSTSITTHNNGDGTSKTVLLGTQKFDSLGRLVEVVSFGRKTSYEYKGTSSKPEIVTLPSGKTITFKRIPELGNKVSSITAEGFTQTFNYDKKTGVLLSAEEADSQVQNIWSKAGLIEKENFVRQGSTRNADHTYTLNGAPLSYTDVTGKQTKYNLDANGNVTNVTDDSVIVDLTYDPLGRIESQTLREKSSTSSLATKFEYNEFDKEIRRTLTDSCGTTLELLQTWLNNGLIGTRTLTKNGAKIRDEQFSYDNRKRLQIYNVSGSHLPSDPYGNTMTKQIFYYDALNNVTSVQTTLSDNSVDEATYHFNNQNDPTQLTTVKHTHEKYPSEINLQYDIEGRMILDEAGRTLKYDVLGRLIGVSGGNTTTTGGTYNYDAKNSLITQRAGENDVRQLYYRGTDLVNELITTQNRDTRLIKLNRNCLGVNEGKNLTLTSTDKNGSLLWSRGNEKDDGELHTWSPYGYGKSVDILPGFNGERIDPVSGSYHLGNGYRAYNPILMRFNCPDNLSPFGAGGINPYAYCSGDPINNIDPSGHISGWGIFGIVVGVIGIGLAVFTGGASIAAAGGIMAAIEATSVSTLVVGALTVVSDVAAIASGALEDSNPKASAALGWTSLATGLPGIVKGVGHLYQAGKNFLRGVKASEEAAEVVTGIASGRGAGNAIELVEGEEILPGSGKWNRIITPQGTRIYAANQAVSILDLTEPIFDIRKAEIMGEEHRWVTVLNGSHGTESGNNWIEAGDMKFWNPRLTDSTFYKQNVELYLHGTLNNQVINYAPLERMMGSLRKRFKIVNIADRSSEQFERLMTGFTDHVILGMCHGRMDVELRRILGLFSAA